MSTLISPSDPTLITTLKVWHVVGPMNHGGAEVMVMELLRHKNPNTEVDFIVHQLRDHVTGSATFDAEIEARGGRIIPIVTPSQSGLIAYFRSFRKIIAEYGPPDIVHSHLNARSGLVALAAWRAGVPRIIVHAHAQLTFRGSLLYRLISNVELAVAKVVFGLVATDFWGCSYEAIRSQFPRIISRRQPTVVIPNAINVEDYVSVTPNTSEGFEGFYLVGLRVC